MARETQLCSQCHGKGTIQMFDKKGNIYWVTCPRCGGSGVVPK